MKVRTKLFTLATLGACCLASQAMAGSQIITFTFGAAGAAQTASPLEGHRVQRILGPGAARSIRGIIQPQCNDCDAASSEDDLVITVLKNAPGCDDPTISTKGFDFDVEWPSSCFDFGESVTFCFTTSKTPIEVQSAGVYDSEGEFIMPATWTVGPVMPSCSPIDCSAAAADPAQLWPPNHKLVPVSITGVTGDAVSIVVTSITQDEPLNSRGDGNTCPDATIVDGVGYVRSERSGNGNGRVYTLSFTATDASGATCSGTATACVPHDQGGQACIDDGQDYNSLAACPSGNGHLAIDPTETEGISSASLRGSNASLAYSIPTRGHVGINVYDVSGRRVVTLLDDVQEAGPHHLSWNVSGLPNGYYFYRVRAEGVSMSRPLLITR